MAKLLIEHTEDVELLTESTDNGKQYFIEGKFAVAGKKNGNGRVYPKAVMEQAVEAFQRDFIDSNRALGELNHPADRLHTDPAEAAILITEMKWMNENDVYGKAKILETPKGMIVRSLMVGGWDGGMSTRGVGSLKENKRLGIREVQSDFRMISTDVVDGPSGPGCFVNMVNESVDYVEKNGIWVPTSTINEDMLFEKIEAFLKGKG